MLGCRYSSFLFMVLILLLPPLFFAGCADGEDDALITFDAFPVGESDIKVAASCPVGTGTPLLHLGSVPGGKFVMGGSGEGTVALEHTVILSPFCVSKYEVTYAQWLEVKIWAEGHGYVFNSSGDMGSVDYGGVQDENHPVTDIEWYDAVLWCNALSEREGLIPCYHTSPGGDVYRGGTIDLRNDGVNRLADGYRLPTEAEWEYACRAGDTSDLYTGEVNHRYSGDIYDNGTTPVGMYEPNAWGLYDMHGNVWEWCWDWYGESYYENSPTLDPWGPDEGLFRVARGGSWHSIPAVALSASNRWAYFPAASREHIGFRPLRAVSAG